MPDRLADYVCHRSRDRARRTHDQEDAPRGFLSTLTQAHNRLGLGYEQPDLMDQH